METRNDITITCAHGVRAHLIELEQHGTYEGLLDGGPTHRVNEMLLENATLFSGRIPTYVVRPPERLAETRFVGPHGPILFMPSRQCRGQFESGGYRLNIVWFQDDWAPPMNPAVLEDLKALDFMAIAFDEVGSW
jgi:hypothetical protein